MEVSQVIFRSFENKYTEKDQANGLIVRVYTKSLATVKLIQFPTQTNYIFLITVFPKSFLMMGK